MCIWHRYMCQRSAIQCMEGLLAFTSPLAVKFTEPYWVERFYGISKCLMTAALAKSLYRSDLRFIFQGHTISALPVQKSICERLAVSCLSACAGKPTATANRPPKRRPHRAFFPGPNALCRAEHPLSTSSLRISGARRAGIGSRSTSAEQDKQLNAQRLLDGRV